MQSPSIHSSTLDTVAKINKIDFTTTVTILAAFVFVAESLSEFEGDSDDDR